MGNFHDVASLVEELTGSQDANEHVQVQPAGTSYSNSDPMDTTPPSEGMNAAAPNTGKNPANTRC